MTEAINRAGRTFGDGELAYLALTSKVERPFLDRFSFCLHQALGPTGSQVAREFPVASAGRADIAILKDCVVSCIIEGKAMTVADCARPEPKRREYAALLQRDLNRYQHAPLPHAAIYCLLLGVHPLSRVPTELRAVIKYLSLLNGAYKKFATAEKIYEEADGNLRGYLHELVGVDAGTFDGGRAFGVHVEVRWWIFGPFHTPAGLSFLRSIPSN